MKKIFTLSFTILASIMLFTACRKERVPAYIDESYWMAQERGVVVYANSFCDFFIVETYNGYSVLRSWDGYVPYQGDVLYGNLSNWGARDFYNRSAGHLIQCDVKDYWLSYYQAEDDINYYCY